MRSIGYAAMIGKNNFISTGRYLYLVYNNIGDVSMGMSTLTDFVFLIPMALAGALFFGAIPVASKVTLNMLRVVGALFGILCAVLLVESLPLLI
jgi:hypothetical protein